MSIEDRAQDHELAEWERNNRAREVVVYKPGDPGYGPGECDECGDDMPDVRRGYGFRLCVPCTEYLERIRALRGR